MTVKIGVISPKPPNIKRPTFLPKDATLFWFNEVEGAFAFLMHEVLDKLYFDEVFCQDRFANLHKYQRLIDQIYPSLEISYLDLALSKYNADDISTLNFFPPLEILLRNGDLKSVFQPIVEADKQKQAIHGIECLSRFNFNGQNFPPEFIFNYASEKLKLTNCDKICLMQALALVPHDQRTLIFINLRPQTLVSNDFYPWFRSLLKKHNLLPDQIVIEITEQYCNISEHAMSEQCKNLRNAGLRVAVDDFGSGISNLSMLEIMKPSYLKISGRFVKRAHLDQRKQKIIKNVFDLAKDFDIAAIVESVETEEEWHQVVSLGARLAQGFYFFRAMDRDNLIRLLNDTASSDKSR